MTTLYLLKFFRLGSSESYDLECWLVNARLLLPLIDQDLGRHGDDRTLNFTGEDPVMQNIENTFSFAATDIEQEKKLLTIDPDQKTNLLMPPWLRMEVRRGHHGSDLDVQFLGR